jgi:trehalose 6-phosphate synthase
VIWVHDYHLIPLAAELRAMGCQQRMGFFLHIPLPPRSILAAIPQHAWLMRSLMMYDLVGFQTEADVEHFAAYVVHEDSGERLDDHEFRVHGRSVRARPSRSASTSTNSRPWACRPTRRKPGARCASSIRSAPAAGRR